MFKATAFIVGPGDGPGAALSDMAKRLGFESVLPFSSTAVAEQQTARTPLLFFLFAAVNDVNLLKPTADAVRFCSNRRVRLSPVIYFSEGPSIEGIRACAGMGFDDVVTLPFTRERVVERLTRQVNRTMVYYETPTYFGPDRRVQSDAVPHERRASAYPLVRRLEIIRTLSDGPSVLHDARVV